MTSTLAERFALAIRNNERVVPVQAHAALVKGYCVQIAYATGITSAPADNDRLGLFGVILDDTIASGSEGRAVISGCCEVMTGDTSAVGTFMNPMADMMVNTVSTQTDGNGFCKLLEAGVDGSVKKAIIVNQ
jgi:hypothetical protein